LNDFEAFERQCEAFIKIMRFFKGISRENGSFNKKSKAKIKGFLKTFSIELSLFKMV
jgi:hypothetical protein